MSAYTVIIKVSLLGYVAMVTGLFGLVVTGKLFTASPLVIALQISGLSLLAWARITFGQRSFHAAANPTEGALITSGPYRYIRHPIYTAVCLLTWPAAIANWSQESVAFALAIVCGALMRMVCEERLLIQNHPDYASYAGTTYRMVPYVF